MAEVNTIELVLRETASDRIVWKAIAGVLVDPAARPEDAAAGFADRVRAWLAQDGLV